MSTKEITFVPTGTLPKPGLIGRGVRLAMAGVLLAWFAPSWIRSFPELSTTTEIPLQPLFWLAVVFAFLNLNYVVNLGLGRSFGKVPQFVIVAAVGVALLLDLILYQTIWAPPLGLLIFFWLLLEFVPLGVAFVLSAILATPGCEMRSYAHLWSRLSNNESAEHYCPGGLDFADKWV